MICEIQHKTGRAGNCLGYDFGDMLGKDQVVEIIDFANISLPPSSIRKLERIPRSESERRTFKKDAHDIANRLSRQFDALAACADERCRTTAVEYIYSFAPEDMENGLLTSDNVRKIIREHLQEMGVHGDVEVKDMHRAKRNQEAKRLHREVMYVATAHKGTNCYHVHVYTSRLDVDTFKASNIHADHERNVKINHRLNIKYGLCEKSRDYSRDLDRCNPDWRHRVWMAETAASALARAKTPADYIGMLKEAGIAVKRKGTGLVYSAVSPDGMVKTLSGGQLTSCLHDGTALTGPQVLKTLRTQRIHERFPFTAGTCHYIIHGPCDATIYRQRSAEGGTEESRTDERFRQALLRRVTFVGAAQGPDEFRDSFVRNVDALRDFRVGTMEMDADGKVRIVRETGFGDRTKSEPWPVKPAAAKNPVEAAFRKVLSEVGATGKVGGFYQSENHIPPYVRVDVAVKGKKSMLVVNDRGEYRLKAARAVTGTSTALRGAVSSGQLADIIKGMPAVHLGVSDENDRKSEDELREEIKLGLR